MIFKPKGVDIHVESRARDQARWAIRDHGDEAEGVMRAKLARDRVSDADRYRYKLTLKEIARLRQSDPEKYGRGKPRGLLGAIKDLLP